MNSHLQRRRLFLFRIAVALAGMTALNSHLLIGRAEDNPWTAVDAVEPSKLAGELARANQSGRPMILYVGFKPLFEGGHIAGASFHGTASTAQGLADLQKWAAALPRTANLVIYCGCSLSDIALTFAPPSLPCTAWASRACAYL